MARSDGRFGSFGGQYVSETLIPALDELVRAWEVAQEEKAFRSELDNLLSRYVGRPTPLYFAKRLSEESGSPDSRRERSCVTSDLVSMSAPVGTAGSDPGPRT